MTDKPISAAEKKRRSKASCMLVAAAETLDSYGHDYLLSKQLREIADDIYLNGKRR